MTVKPKRKPFTKEEKAVIFEKMNEANSRGLDLTIIAKELAEEYNASHFTIRNIYNRERAKLKEAEQPEQLELSVEEVESVDTSKDSSHVTTLSDDLKEIINIQTRTMLDKLEKIIEERDEWKQKYEQLLEENKKLKDKIINQLLS